MKNRLIYALVCPVTNEPHYVGKSTQGMIRPSSHLVESHSKKIQEWVNDLRLFGTIPEIRIIEYVPEEIDIDSRERYWISKYLQDGYILLNETLVKPINIDPNLLSRVERTDYSNFDEISKFVKDRRKLVGLTQEEFASKMGIALTVVRKIEQGSSNITLKSLVSVLDAFNAKLSISRK